MPNSDYVFQSGEPVEVGQAGDHAYEFVSGSPLVDSGASEFVFVSGTGIGSSATGIGSSATVIDDLERGDLSPYIQYGNQNAGITTSPTYEGTYAIAMVGNDNALVSYPGDGLPYYPVRGDVIEYYTWLSSGNDMGVEIDFCVQHHGYGNEYWYEASLNNFDRSTNPGSVHIGKRKGDSWDIGPIRSGDPLPSDTWLRCRIEIGDPTIAVTGYYPDGSGGWTAEATVSMDDTEWSSGGVGWHTSQSGQTGGDIYADLARKTGTV